MRSCIKRLLHNLKFLDNLFFFLILKTALPSITIKLDIALINVSTVEIVKAKPSIITNSDNNSF